MCVSCLFVGVKAKVCGYTLCGLWFILGHCNNLRTYNIEQLNKWWTGKDLVGRGCGLVQVTSWYLNGGIEENLEGPQDI